MPSKEELIAKVMFLINSPAQRLAVRSTGVARNLAVVIDQAAKKTSSAKAKVLVAVARVANLSRRESTEALARDIHFKGKGVKRTWRM